MLKYVMKNDGIGKYNRCDNVNCNLIATIIAIANIAIKIYSNAILNYGTKMGIKDIIKMYKDKQN